MIRGSHASLLTCTLCPAGFQASGSATLTLRLFQVSPSIRPNARRGHNFGQCQLLVGGAERHSREPSVQVLETVRSIEPPIPHREMSIDHEAHSVSQGSPPARVWVRLATRDNAGTVQVARITHNGADCLGFDTALSSRAAAARIAALSACAPPSNPGTFTVRLTVPI